MKFATSLLLAAPALAKVVTVTVNACPAESPVTVAAGESATGATGAAGDSGYTTSSGNAAATAGGESGSTTSSSAAVAAGDASSTSQEGASATSVYTYGNSSSTATFSSTGFTNTSSSAVDSPVAASSTVVNGTSTAVTASSSVTSTSASGTTSSSSSSVTSSATATYSFADDFISTVLSYHNSVRAIHQAPTLTWNPTLATYAAEYIDSVKDACTFAHSGGPYGENLALGYPDALDGMEAWYAEGENYNYTAAEFSDSTGHFTQVVWVDTTGIGCYIADCGDGRPYLACEYDPRGNVVGEFAENVLPASS